MKKKNNTHNDDLLWEEIRKSKQTRIKLAMESQYWFFHIYFGENAKCKTAEFQKEIYALTEDPGIKHAVICSFRGSGKSTIATLCCPIWSILGVPERKFVLILSQTQPLAKAHLMNIKRAFETNELLRNDFGPLEETSDEWGSMSLSLPKYKARISAASVDQSIRGLRHGAHRPDLIIADDVEDMASAKTREGRERTWQWFVSEVIPAGDQDTKVINIGNLLHEDSLLMRLKERIDGGTLDAVYKEYPIVGADGTSLWPGKYPDQASLEKQRQKVIDERSWLREYMLKIVPDNDQIIMPEWIKYYDELPPKDKANQFIGTFVGVDLAISERTSADCTAVIVAHVYGNETKDRQYYIDPHFINKRVSFKQTVEEIVQLYHGLKDGENDPHILVEEVGYQAAMVEALKDEDVSVKGIKIRGDKYSRLMASGMLFEHGRVYFPKNKDMKVCIQQILGFGVEKHDDLVDATTLVLNYVHSKVEYGIIFAMISRHGDDNDIFYGITYKD